MPRSRSYTDAELTALQARAAKAEARRRAADRKAAQEAREVARVQQAIYDEQLRTLGQLVVETGLAAVPPATLREALPWLAFVLQHPDTWQRFVAFFREVSMDEWTEWVMAVVPANDLSLKG